MIEFRAEVVSGERTESPLRCRLDHDRLLLTFLNKVFVKVTDTTTATDTALFEISRSETPQS